MIRSSQFVILIFLLFSSAMPAQNGAGNTNFSIENGNGHDLWLQYFKVEDQQLLQQYRSAISEIVVLDNSPTASIIKDELRKGLSDLLDKDISIANEIKNGALVVKITTEKRDPKIKGDGYSITSEELNGKKVYLIKSNTSIGGLYGAFGFLRLIQTEQKIANLEIFSSPKIDYRMLNHWDRKNENPVAVGSSVNLGRWNELPDKIDPIYAEYARANASIGINGTVLNNFTTDIIKKDDILKAAALAKIYKPYGLRVYLSINFASPIKYGNLSTADPNDPEVKKWWKNKTDEIYKVIPNFGGFLVKADSEGMPGPQQYHRTHAEAANMLASVLKPHGGILIWRAFVYDQDVDPDRAKRAFMQFKPLDGKFDENVIVQVKNGPMDFQPREPFHPLFGSMPNTPLAMEFEIYKEYLGKRTDLVYLGEEWEEVLQSETYKNKEGVKVARIVDGSAKKQNFSLIAGVANVHTDSNWTDHPFNQANWYAFGRLAWNPDLKAKSIAEEWTRMTWGNNPQTVNTVTNMMSGSWLAAVNVMGPLGLNFVCARDHYNPDPAGRVNDYWYADENGIGFNRTDHHEEGWDETTNNENKIGYNRKEVGDENWKEKGSGYVDQYHEPLRSKYNSMDECPEEFLLWFHFVPWDFKMDSDRSLWKELCFKYESGYEYSQNLRNEWSSLEGKIDSKRYELVTKKLKEQQEHYKLWRDVCLEFFSKISGRQLPDFVSE